MLVGEVRSFLRRQDQKPRLPFGDVQRADEDLAAKAIGQGARGDPRYVRHTSAQDIGALAPAQQLRELIRLADAARRQVPLPRRNPGLGDRFDVGALRVHAPDQQQRQGEMTREDRHDPLRQLADFDMPARFAPDIQVELAQPLHAAPLP